MVRGNVVSCDDDLNEDFEVKYIFSKHMLIKLDRKHSVTEDEVIQAIGNSTDDDDLDDTREEHLSNPITKCFLGETNAGRLLKVCFVFCVINDVHTFFIKSAYEPSDETIEYFERETGKRYR